MTKKLKWLEKTIYAFDDEFHDLGWTKVVMAEDLHRCATCGWHAVKEYAIPDGFGGYERGTDGLFCGRWDTDCNAEDFCAWWDEYGGDD